MTRWMCRGEAKPVWANDPGLIHEMLHQARTIAVVGMSDKPWRASRNIGRYLAENGYKVFPVNPALSEVAGMTLLSQPRCRASRGAGRVGAGN